MERSQDNFVLYRLPEHTRYTYMAQTSGALQELRSVADLGGCVGFVMAPFMASADHPILLLRPDVVEEHELEPCGAYDADKTVGPESDGEKAAYAATYAAFHRAVEQGRFGKLVLSRCSPVAYGGRLSAEALFRKACSIYPHQFVALVSVAKAGTWLMATPEVLLDGAGGKWRTMALAGTMRRSGQGDDVGQAVWSEKNVEEQRYVSRYVERILTRHAHEVTERGPYTAIAAHLLHLRTDFTFRLARTEQVGLLLDALHPTPAVCGMPKEEAMRFVIDNETTDRKYYSGFCGPLMVGGQTHLYVSLRCMEICHDGMKLYAGGGILKDSTMEQEWAETQSKLQTMRRLLND